MPGVDLGVEGVDQLARELVVVLAGDEVAVDSGGEADEGGVGDHRGVGRYATCCGWEVRGGAREFLFEGLS